MSGRGRGRGRGGRRIPFSGARKKQQLKEKRRQKREQHENRDHSKQGGSNSVEKEEVLLVSALGTLKLDKGCEDKRSFFQRESRDAIEKRKLLTQKPLVRPKPSQEQNLWEKWQEDKEVHIPIRDPNDAFEMFSAKQLKNYEKEVFQRWLESIYDRYEPDQLNFFEQNLNVWRQLWRTVEFSHVVLLILDARFPLFFFSYALYEYVTQTLRRPMIIVLNKSDLVSGEHLRTWLRFFEFVLVSTPVVPFSSRRVAESDSDGSSGAERGALETAQALIKARSRQQRQMVYEACGLDELLTTIDRVLREHPLQLPLRKGRHVVGLIGSPSVGKSSVLNALVNRRAVSTSRTPGHTKHLQTIVLNERLLLCDCPGLVFPSVVYPRHLQILMGIYPIAQVQEPFSAVQYVAEHSELPLQLIYKLQPPIVDVVYEANAADAQREVQKSDFEWSAFAICEAVALANKFLSARGGRADAHRGARFILTDVIDGRLRFRVPPPPLPDGTDGAILNHGQTQVEEEHKELAITD